MSREAGLLQEWQEQKKQQAARQPITIDGKLGNRLYFTAAYSNAILIIIDAKHLVVQSTLNASVWQILVEEGQVISAGSVVAILEAMKMEISVRAPTGPAAELSVVSLLKEPGDLVEAGDTILILKPCEDSAK